MGSFSHRQTGLVRNVSLPILAHATTTSPGSQHPRVPRVSSFSKMTKPPPYRRQRSNDPDADGLVPELAPKRQRPFVILSRRSSPDLLALQNEEQPCEDGEVVSEDGEVVSDEDEHPVSMSQPLSVQRMKEDRSSHSATPSHSRNVSEPSEAVSGPPCTLHPSTDHHGKCVEGAKAMLTECISHLQAFVPPHATPSVKLKMLFVSAMSVMTFLPALITAIVLPGLGTLQWACFGMLCAPVVGRLSASVALATGVLLCAVMVATMTVANAVSPVVLVWTSLVPVIAFATLGNRAGLVLSGITAAAVCMEDFEDKEWVGKVHGGIVAAWVLFLGCTGVVQTHVKTVAFGEEWRERSGVISDEGD